MPANSLLCPTCLQALQPEKALDFYSHVCPTGQTFEIFRKATAGSCFICSDLRGIYNISPDAWKDVDEGSWRPSHFQIKREDWDAEESTFTIEVGRTYPSDDNTWNGAVSIHKLIRVDGMVAFNITITSH